MFRIGVRALAALVTGLALIAGTVVAGPTAQAATATPHPSGPMMAGISHLAPLSLRDPSGNVTAVPAIANTADCGGVFSSPINSQSCIKDALNAINHARALEGVVPMHLPSNFASLNEAQKNFVVTNAERVDRGLQPLKALCSVCDAAAVSGIVNGYDPHWDWPFPAGVNGFASNWAGGMANALVADYDWMYNDGWGGPGNTFNFDCTSPTASGCWGHRHDILISCQSACDLFYGAAEGTGPNGWATSFADIIAAMAPGAQPSLDASPPPAWPIPFCSPSQYGYRIFSSGGAVAARGLLTWCGGMDIYPHAAAPIVAGADSWDRGGYYLVSATGRVWGFGDATAVVTQGWPVPANNSAQLSTVNGFAADPVRNGYWEIGSSACASQWGCGGINNKPLASFGGAKDYGYPTSGHMVGIASSPDGKGYWILLADGQVNNFGDAPAYVANGSTAIVGKPISITRDASGKGFWVLTSSGQVIGYGDAQNYGNATIVPGQKIVGIAGDHSGNGYWILRSDGHTSNFGDANALPGGFTPAVAISS